MKWHLLTPEEFQKIWDFQHGKCAICGAKLNKANVDHEHSGPEAGFVRGLLCPACNRALGRFRDSLILILAAAGYLQDPPAVKALGRRHYGLPGRVGTKKQRAVGRAIKEGKYKGEWKGDPERLRKEAA